MKHRKILPVLYFIIVVLLSSCSDWVEQEGLTIKYANIAEQNPELYAKYLENLRAYKNSDHKVIYAWFDNSIKMPVSRAHHLSSVPDSIDIVTLMHPDSLNDREISEMSAIRKDKGTKVIYAISYPAIEKEYNAIVDSELEKAKAAAGDDPNAVIESATQNAGFSVYLEAYTNKALAISDKFEYDGISFRYDSKNTTYMVDNVKEQYLADQTMFIGKLEAWAIGHPDKILVFEGQPQYLADKSILSSCQYIVLHTVDASSASELSLSIRMVMTDNVPTDRFIVCVSTFSLDPTDVKTGRFLDASGNYVSALTQAATWVSTYETGFTKAGLGIYNIQNDYYNTSLIYKNVRDAIGIMNPSPKN